MEHVRLLTESISSYVFAFVTKLNWMNKTLLKLRVIQWDSASPLIRLPLTLSAGLYDPTILIIQRNVIFSECYVSKNKQIRVSSS